MQQEHVQVIGLQPAQARLQALPEPVDRKLFWTFRRVTEFADENDLVAFAAQRLAENALAPGCRIVGGCIEQVDAAVNGRVNQAQRGLVVHAAPRIVVAQLPGPIADFGDFQPG